MPVPSLIGLSTQALTGLASVVRVAASIPDPAPVAPPGVDAAVSLVFAYGKWVAYALCGLAAIVAGARTAIEVRQHGGSGEAVKQLMLALVGAGIVTGAVTIVSKAVG